ncbi:Protein translocase subunit SecY [secondary endosymbiont of Trabutina mannipara]|uniref:Protein translocase subunit SecY n=1 Tax=secondary endosymbiont of Trabutina mannipara TaxID=1835721 RepID=A0A1C3L476_9ENTR|nr:preprotein translocase subunit SecY [secondary endosymbiont of Trabutina mannipara]SBT82093.1 Protein translocase subunit SecY [secondary endosymbiont of Trabutina mannipara]
MDKDKKIEWNVKRGIKELKSRFLFVIGSLIVFRIGSFIPIPGINSTVFTKLIEQQRSTIIDMFNMFSGGALNRASVFALGIMPYISSSIIIQLLTVIHPTLSEIKKEGEFGIQKINQYARYGALVLAIFQAISFTIGLPNMPEMQSLVIIPGISFYLTAILSLVCGTIFLMWLGEQITDRGIGNGISLIIFTGIIAGLPTAISYTIKQTIKGYFPFLCLLLVAFLVFAVTFFVIFIEHGQRRIIVNYAKHQQQGRCVYLNQNTHLPLKVNMAGVLPAIFASSIILFPATIVSWFGGSPYCGWLTNISLYLQPGQPLYALLYASAIIFLCYFYTTIVLNSRETADNLKKLGVFVPGIRPGEQTAKYIDQVMNRLTLVGAMYITFICLIPEFMRNAMKVPFYFGGTSLLIVVVVIMDFMTQVQTMSTQYEYAFLKETLKSYNR